MVDVRNLVFPSLIFLCCLNFYRMYYCFRKPQNQQRQLFFIIPLVSSGFNKCLHMVDQASHYFSRSLLHLFHPFPNTRPTDLPTLLRKKKKNLISMTMHIYLHCLALFVCQANSCSSPMSYVKFLKKYSTNRSITSNVYK